MIVILDVHHVNKDVILEPNAANCDVIVGDYWDAFVAANYMNSDMILDYRTN